VDHLAVSAGVRRFLLDDFNPAARQLVAVADLEPLASFAVHQLAIFVQAPFVLASVNGVSQQAEPWQDAADVPDVCFVFTNVGGEVIAE